MKVKPWSIATTPGEKHELTVIVLAVFTKYNGKYWIRSNQGEIDYMNAKASKASQANAEKKANEAKLLVQCILIDEEDDDIEYITPVSEKEARNVFQIIKMNQLISVLGCLDSASM